MAHLHALDESLQQVGGRLLVRSGSPTVLVPEIAKSLGADLAVQQCRRDPLRPTARSRRRACNSEARSSNGGAIWSRLRDRYARPRGGSHGSSPRSPPNGAAQRDRHGRRAGRPSSTTTRARAFPSAEAHPSSRAAKRRRGTDCMRSRSGSTTIRPPGTCRPSTARHSFRPTCASACSRRARSPTRSGRRPKAERPSSASWPGGTGTPTSCGSCPRWSTPPCDPSSTASHGRTIRPTSRPGRKVVPAIRSSMPACASWPPRAGCTTASAWSPPRSS